MAKKQCWNVEHQLPGEQHDLRKVDVPVPNGKEANVRSCKNVFYEL